MAFFVFPFFDFHIPHIPDIPDISHIPDIPHIPHIPDIPDIPDIPHIPEIFDLGISSQTGFFLGGVFSTTWARTPIPYTTQKSNFGFIGTFREIEKGSSYRELRPNYRKKEKTVFYCVSLFM